MLRTFRRSSSWVALLALFSFSLQACSDSVQSGKIIFAGSTQNDGWGQFSGDVGTGTGAGDTGNPNTADHGSAADADPGDIVVKRQIILKLDTTKPSIIGPSAVLPIFADVIDYSVGGPASGVPVFWEITANNGVNGPGKGALSSQNTFTDPTGETGNVFSANKSPSTGYTIRVSCDGAESVEFTIQVTDLPVGGIKIKMTYDNQVAIGDLTVRLVASPFACASFKANKPPDQFLGSKSSFLSDTPEFDNLGADKKYGVYVLAKNPAGHLAAAGCADGILVADKQVTEVTVTLTTLALQASGVYDMVNHFDFTGAIPGQLGQILDTAVQIFYDPGAFIIEQIKNLVKQLLPSIIVDTVFSLFQDQLAKVVTDWLLSSSPPWLQKFFQMGQEVLQVVKNLEMIGELKIFKVSNDFFVKGEMDFTGVNLYWKAFYGCDKNSPPDCGKWALDMSNATSDPNFPMNLVAGTFTGSVSQQVNLSIDSGTIKLNYGKLILYVLTNLILKSITGESTFSGAMAKLINCDGIANGIGNSILGKLGLSVSTVKGICDSAVNLLVLPLEQMLGGLALDSNLSLNGTAVLEDDDDDLKVDQIVDGVWTGNISSATPGKPFKGDWSAVRQPGN